MPIITKTVEPKLEVSYGYRHDLGYFMQVHDTRFLPDDGVPMLSLTNLPKSALVKSLEEYGVTLSPDEDIETEQPV